jgi:hypothetical protein
MRLKDVTIARTTICQQTHKLKSRKVCDRCPNQCPREQRLISIRTNKPRASKRMSPAKFDAAFLRAVGISWSPEESEGQ